MYHKDDLQMAGVHEDFGFFFFEKQLACHSLIDKNQKTVQSHRGQFL